jgi:hypothetical protein
MKRGILIFTSLFIFIFASGCGPGELFGPIVTPSPTSTITPQITNTPGLPGTIIGTVVDSSGAPLEGVGIKLLKKRNLVTEIKTNAEGKFTFENVPTGKYTIGYDYFPEGGFTIHYFSTEFELESEMTSQQDYVISVK